MSEQQDYTGRKRLLLLMDTMGGGGAEKSILEVMKRLPPTRFDVDLILYLNKGVHLADIPAHVHVSSVYPDGEKRLFEKVLFHSPWRERYEAHKTRRLVGDKRYDAVISFMEGPSAAIHRYVADRAERNITWVHIDMAGCHWSREFFRSDDDERRFYNSVDHIVFVSQDAMAKFIYDVNTPRNCIYNMVDAEAIRSRSREFVPKKSRFTISFIGRLVPHKHAERLLEAVSLLKRRGIDVEGWVLGQGEMREQLETHAATLGVSDRITFHGFQSNPYPFIAATDVLCITSDAEGLPIVVQEAMTLGTPIVSTRCAGMNEAICDGAGIFVDSTPVAFADAVEKLFKNPALRDTITDAARRRMTMFDPENIIRQIENLITGGPVGA